MRFGSLACRAPTPLVRALGQQGSSAAARVRGVMLPYAALVALTATSGAFVAGELSL
jgi:hypothetical protein